MNDAVYGVSVTQETPVVNDPGCTESSLSWAGGDTVCTFKILFSQNTVMLEMPSMAIAAVSERQPQVPAFKVICNSNVGGKPSCQKT